MLVSLFLLCVYLKCTLYLHIQDRYNYRYRHNNHLIVENVNDHFNGEYPDFVKKQLEVNNGFDGLDSDDNNQGLIIKFKDLVFRLYNNKYADAIKTKPKYRTKQEELFHKLQINQFGRDLSDERTLTINAFNFISIMLLRLMNHFTKFESRNNYQFRKINNDDYDKIKDMPGSYSLMRNLNKLQNLPSTINKFVDFNQVKYHLKNYCYYRELHELFTFCYNKEIMDIVKYKHPKIIENNLNQFHKLRLKRKNKKTNNIEEQVIDGIVSDINNQQVLIV